MDTSTWLEFAAIVAAGFGAGTINAIVGSGTLISFPLLLLFGYPPLTANISSAIGLVTGNFAGAYGYRREIHANSSLVKLLVPSSILGGITGAGLLLILPPEAFQFIVPILILLGMVMVVLGPIVQKRTAGKIQEISRLPLQKLTGARKLTLIVVVYLLGIYGGYFGAAQGILMVGVLGMLLTISMQSINAVKNFLVGFVNLVAALTFVFFAGEHINWFVALSIALGATLGGLAGAKIGRRLPPNLLRGFILLVGTAALVNMLL